MEALGGFVLIGVPVNLQVTRAPGEALFSRRYGSCGSINGVEDHVDSLVLRVPFVVYAELLHHPERRAVSGLGDRNDSLETGTAEAAL